MKAFDTVLASGSPRRLEIFENNGYTVRVMPADVEETLPEKIKPSDGVMLLALRKALHTEEKLIEEGAAGDNVLVVAADTVVYKDRIMGKPGDEDEAFDMLSRLRNSSSLVITGVALKAAGKPYGRVFYDVSEVFFRDYSDEVIREYIATGEPMDKAGAYAIQGGFGKHIREYKGSYSNIVGFPWEKFQEELKKFREDLG